MQKTFFHVLLAAVTAAVMLSACSRIPEESRHIPKNAGIVLGINSKQISQKLVTNGFTMDKLFSALQQKDTSSEAFKTWKEIEQSGMDLTGNIFAAVVFNGASSYVSITGGLKDAARFEGYLQKHVAGYAQKIKNDFKYSWVKSDNAIVGWTGKTVIYLRPFDMDELKNKGRHGIPGLPAPDNRAGSDTAQPTATPAALVTTAEEGNEAVWAAEVDRLFHLKAEESAGNIDAFRQLLKESGDLSFFVHPEVIYNNQLTMLPANFKKLLENAYQTGVVNFEQGKVLVNSRAYAGQELTDIYKKYGNGEADMDLLEKYPSGNVTGFMNVGFDPRIIGEVIKSTGADGLVNMAMGRSGLTLDDVLAAFKGQLVFVSSDFTMKKQPLPYSEQDSTVKAESKWVFCMKVGDKAAFNKLMTSPMLGGMFRKEGSQYVMQQSPPGLALSVNEQFVTAASDAELLQQYLSGKGKLQLENDLLGKMKGKPMGAYVNFEKIASNIPDDNVPAEGKPLAAQAKALLKDLQVVAHPFKDGRQESEAVLTFRNEQENSLAQLLNLGTAVAAYYNSQQAREDSLANAAASAADMTADTTAVAQ